MHADLLRVVIRSMSIACHLIGYCYVSLLLYVGRLLTYTANLSLLSSIVLRLASKQTHLRVGFIAREVPTRLCAVASNSTNE